MTKSRIAVVTVGLLGLAGLTGCMRPYVSVYDEEGLQRVRAWHVDFTYESGEYEEVVQGGKNATSRVLKKGHPPVALQLRDDVLFRLRDEQGIPTVIHKEEADGMIKLHPLHYALGGFHSVDVQLQDPAERLLARVRFTNGGNKPAMGNERFAAYMARILGEVIRGERPKKRG